MEALLLKYYHRELNAEEIEKVEAWLEADEKNRKQYESMVRIWEQSPNASVFEHIPVKGDWQKVRAQISGSSVKKGKGRSLNFFLKVAAGLALLISLGIAGYYTFLEKQQQVFVAASQLSPEKNQIILADGSKVTLNANSKLFYPTDFDGERRMVRLEGEGYFEIERNPEKPFIIQHGNSETRVLGTKFNLRAYPQEAEVKVAVTEGKVRLSERNRAGKHIDLTKNKLGIYNRSTKTMVRLDNMDENFLSWRTGVLNFRNASLSKVVKDLKRHYRVDFVLQNTEEKNQNRVSARFENQDLEDVLQELSLILGINFTMKKNYVLVEN